MKAGPINDLKQNHGRHYNGTMVKIMNNNKKKKKTPVDELKSFLIKAAADDKKNAPQKINPGKKSFSATHEFILESAASLFAKKGFKSCTTRGIASAAGVSEVTLYRHFDSKEKIYIEVIKNMTLLKNTEDLLKISDGLDIKQKLTNIASKFVALFKEKSNDLRIMISEIIMRPDMAAIFFEMIPGRGIEILSQIMSVEIKKGNFKKTDPKILSRAFIGMFLAYNIMQELFFGNKRDPQDERNIIEGFIDIFLNGVIDKQK